MRHIVEFLTLPASLLLTLSLPVQALSDNQRWPYNLPSHMKYYPEDEIHIRRESDIEQRLAKQSPAGVKKMGADEGEKFFLDYWQFEGHGGYEAPFLHSPHIDAGSRADEERQAAPYRLRPTSRDDNDLEQYTNASSSQLYQPPFPLHINDQSLLPQSRRWLPRGVFSTLSDRAFSCPNQTTNCSSIGRPNSCCAQGETCQLITDSGLGDVGCCGQGKTCSGQVLGCTSGYSSCPNNPGGGCCIPNYACVDIGCALNSTVTVVVLASASTTRTSTSTIALIPSAITSSSSSITTTSASSARSSAPLNCSTGYRSCPATLGGGCCPTDRDCGATFCPERTASASAGGAGVVPAVRPTGSSSIVTTTTPPPSTSTTPTGISSAVTGTACPDGFYQCSAYYRGGCCRVGRDCGMTSCPNLPTTAILTGNGITIVAPTGASVATISAQGTASSAPGSVPTTTSIVSGGASAAQGNGGCPSGWFSCAPSANGGCCLNGYTCGTATCAAPASATGARDVGKIAPSSANGLAGGRRWWGLGAVVLISAVVLL